MKTTISLHFLMATLILCVRAIKADSPQPEQSFTGVCSGLPGAPGISGHSGLPGRDGLQGQKGSDGAKGTQGDKGAKGNTGKTGPKGSLGERGQTAVGQKGMKGEKGANGTAQGENGSIHAINWKQCAWEGQDQRNTGVLQRCVFKKRHMSTALKVAYAGTLRAYCRNCCGRWYFTFNGNECSEPKAIDGIVYNDNGSNVHRDRHIEGFCENIPSGSITVHVHVGSCVGYGTADCSSGWAAVSRIMIEEYPPSQSD